MLSSLLSLRRRCVGVVWGRVEGRYGVGLEVVGWGEGDGRGGRQDGTRAYLSPTYIRLELELTLPYER